MPRVRKPVGIGILALLFVVSIASVAYGWTPLPVKDDPLPRMPGTQPNQVALESPNRCLNCHEGYNQAVEPGFNWMGSMMAQSARDFIFWSAMTVAAQDAVAVVGNPNATDLCLRCHFPKGWLEGRSDPTNASAMTGADFDGVQCDFCHQMWDPFFEDTYTGNGESADWLNHWDETNLSGTPSQEAATATYQEDMVLAGDILLFNGEPFYVGNQPHSGLYTEATSGQYFVSPNADKRASFADAEARHQMLYSRFHKSEAMCGTCHDVSNAVLANLGADPTLPLPSEEAAAYSYFHVERTFSEFVLSDYGQPGGAPGMGPFAPDVFETSFANNYISSCQDCHMRDVVGTAANKNGAVVRPDGSVEHPNSGQPLHDLTGGNVWVSAVLASAVPGSPNYDPINDALLNQGPAVLTLDLTAGQGINPEALLAGSQRALQQLQLAATIEGLTYDAASGALSFQVQNQTGHKLISGFPEGRRMFVTVRVYQGNQLLQTINPYDPAAGTLKGLHYAYGDPGGGPGQPGPLGANEIYVDELVYEMHPSSSITGETETFHFVLADGRYKDNRIPPRGFDIANAAARMSEPVWNGVVAPDYFTAAEYAGGYDAVSLTVPAGGDRVEVELYYQTTSREYMAFLRDQINGTGNLTLDPADYIIQTDPFFAGLRAWGDTIWQLWTHNMNLPGAAPVLMTSASVGYGGGGQPPTCNPPAPTLLSAAPGHTTVALAWSDEAANDARIAGYNVYYDQQGKLQLVADAGLTTSFTDTGLTNGQEYCYVVTSYYDATCESPPGNVICAVPSNQVQGALTVASVEVGIYEGKGGNATFTPLATFAAGDEIIFRVRLVDADGGLPVANATADLEISGPEGLLLTTGTSDADGYTEVSWKTDKPRGNSPGTTPGSYAVSVLGAVADGFLWDGAAPTASFTIQ